tara:strand:+ start:405 stop:650 length:246 start_codon:yes stop_codon:yes gene_type:complete
MDKLTATAISDLTKHFKDDNDYYTISGAINQVARMIHQSFINDFDKNVTDALLEVPYSLDKIADALNNIANELKQDRWKTK